jgi:hypothetical protein
MEEYEQGGGGDPEAIYEGWASKDPEPEDRGRLSIEGALRHAYENAKSAGARPPFVLVTTEVHGENPISDYKVGIKQKP